MGSSWDEENRAQNDRFSGSLYGEYEIIIEIETGVVTGSFPKRSLRHILEWHDQHQAELAANWELCRQREDPNFIDSLK